MKILLVADEPSRSYWDYYDETKLKGLDLILSAGDLPAEYLSFLVTFSNCPLLYVPGNHDTGYQTRPPEGCLCIDDTVFEYRGIRILGLGGSRRYNAGVYQYTEREMQRRIRRVRFRIWKHGGIDILLTHAPVRGCGDQDDLPHQGFECFRSLIETYSPSYMVHGHVHKSYSHDFQRIRKIGDTTVINAYERYLLDYPLKNE